MGASIIPESWDVPVFLKKRFGNSIGRQRARFHENHLIIALHSPPGRDDVHRAGRLFWRNPEGVWKTSAAGSGIGAMDDHLKLFEAKAIELENREEKCKSAQEYFGLIEELAPVARAAKNMHEALQEARELVPDDAHLINYRDQAYQIARITELTYQTSKDALDYSIAKRGEEEAVASASMAAASHRLNTLVALFFPLATIMTIFGTNLQHGWETSDPPVPFYTAVILGLMAGLFTWRIIARPMKK